MDKQQGPTVQHRELYSISWNRPGWKRILKKKNVYIYIYIYDGVTLLYNRNWHNIVDQLYFKEEKSI